MEIGPEVMTYHPPKPQAEKKPKEDQKDNSAEQAPAKDKKTEREFPDITTSDVSRWIGVDPPPLIFTVEDLIPQGMVTLLTAEGGAGKTLLCQLAMTCAAAGQSFLGKTTLAGRAAGVFAEDPTEVLHLRQTRINAALGLDMETLAHRVYPQSYFGLDASLWKDHKSTKFFDLLERQLETIECLRLLTLDNTALVYSGDESSRVEVTQFINALNGMARRLEVGIVLTAHRSKSFDDSALRSTSGSTAWINACRSVLRLDKDKDETSLTLLKANHTKPGEKIDLEWRDNVLLRPVRDDFKERFDRHELDQEIFNRVATAWTEQSPYGAKPQTGDRYLPRVIARTTNFKIDQAHQAMLTLMDGGYLIEDRHSTRTPLGLRVKQLPDGILPSQ